MVDGSTIEQSTYAGWTFASGWARQGEIVAPDSDGEDDEDNSPTTSQTTEVFPVPLDPMQNMGGGTYTDAPEEDTIRGGVEAVRDSVADKIP